MNTGYAYASGRVGVGAVAGEEVFRPLQASSLGVYTVAPQTCEYFKSNVFGRESVCNFGRGDAPRNVYVKQMPQWVAEAATLFVSRGGNGAPLSAFTPEEFQRMKEMAAFIQQPPPTPNGYVIWNK